jgi:hypothetical protein
MDADEVAELITFIPSVWAGTHPRVPAKASGRRPAVSEGIAPKFEEAINRLLQQNRSRADLGFRCPSGGR